MLLEQTTATFNFDDMILQVFSRRVWEDCTGTDMEINLVCAYLNGFSGKHSWKEVKTNQKLQKRRLK